jgi:hypothetical protein
LFDVKSGEQSVNLGCRSQPQPHGWDSSFTHNHQFPILLPAKSELFNLPCGVDRSTDLVLLIAVLPEIHATVRALQEIGKEWNQGETDRRNGICAYPGYRLRSTLIKICQGGGFLLDND